MEEQSTFIKAEDSIRVKAMGAKSVEVVLMPITQGAQKGEWLVFAQYHDEKGAHLFGSENFKTYDEGIVGYKFTTDAYKDKT